MKSPRTTKPGAGNKYYIRQASGGYSTCITGKPTDANCNVLANCVGFACGFFNEELDLGYEKYHLNCNAENFIERAIASGLSVVQKPVVGGILVWQKGATLSGSDGAGHVAGVTSVDNVDNPTKVTTSESGYGGTAFWTATRSNANGKWGAGADYKYRGCIVPPGYVPPKPEPKPEPVTPTKFKVGDKVVINGALYVSANAAAPSGVVTNKVTQITRAITAAHPYNTTGDLGWMNESDIRLYEEPKPEPPKPTGIAVGDIVKVTGAGNASSSGTSRSWTRKYNNQTMKVILIKEGAAYPYACNQYGSGTPGNPADVTGWFSKSSVTK